MERDGKRWKEMERDGKRWKEMERDGKRWKEMERDGKRWKEMEKEMDGSKSIGKFIQLALPPYAMPMLPSAQCSTSLLETSPLANSVSQHELNVRAFSGTKTYKDIQRQTEYVPHLSRASWFHPQLQKKICFSASHSWIIFGFRLQHCGTSQRNFRESSRNGLITSSKR